MQTIRTQIQSTTRTYLTAFLLCIVFVPATTRAAEQVSEWREIFVGIDWATASSDEPLLRINALRIDLTAPGIRFFSTPDNGDSPEETDAQTTSQFLQEFELQVAVNGNFFAPCCAALAEPKDLLGLAISEGRIVSPYTGAVSRNINEVPDALLITAGNQATIDSTLTGQNFSGIETAVSAGPRLLLGGQIVVPAVAPEGLEGFYGPNPRTAVGLTADQRTLIFLTIDGRQPEYSVGATLFETAQWLRRLGAYQGLNLDGGGSTTMVREDYSGNPAVLNRPSSINRAERYNGNNIGVFATGLNKSAVDRVPAPLPPSR